MRGNSAIEIGARQSEKLVQALALQTRQPLDDVRQVYERQFQRLEKYARVKIYVPVLAARHAREILVKH